LRHADAFPSDPSVSARARPLITRRRALAGGLAGLVAASAGCAGLDYGRDEPARRLQLRLFREGERLRERFVVDLADTPLERDEEAFAAVRDGETYRTQGHRPFGSRPDDPVYTRHEGTYYRLGSVVVDEVTRSRPVLRLFAVESSADATDATDTTDAVPAADLPRSDRRAVQIAHMAARARGDEGGVPWGLVQRGGYVYRSEAAETSELLTDDGPDRVRYRETTYRVAVSRERFHEPVYEATARPVAETPARMEAVLRARFVGARFAGDELSADARDLLATARTDGYSESHPYSEAYRAVLERLHERAYIDGNIEKDAGVRDNGRRLLRYDGVYYEYRLVFVGGSRATG
jgi:hypothetical protein